MSTSILAPMLADGVTFEVIDGGLEYQSECRDLSTAEIEYIQTNAPSLARLVPHLPEAATLCREYQHIRFMWKECTETLRQRKDLSADCRRAGKEAFERMRLRVEAIKSEIAQLQK